MAVVSTSATQFIFDSVAGRQICRDIAEPDLKYEPHSYSLDVAVKIIDGRDCLVRAACGSGKTGILALITLCILKLGKNKDLCPPGTSCDVMESPVVVVVCPTNALEVDLEHKLSRFNIPALAINSSRVQQVHEDAAFHGQVWDLAKKATVILISPEMLEGDNCRDLLDDPAFYSRVFLLVVDEAHLVYFWSKQFRKAYGRIGTLRNRLNNRARLLLLTATLRAGKPFDAVMNSFSLHPGAFYDLHRSNLRPEIRVTTSTMYSSLKASLNFAELEWIVGMGGISIIFTRDRSLTLRISLYLKNTFPMYASTIRKCDSTNDTDYEEETLELIRGQNSRSAGLLLVSTTILTLGVDIANVQRVVILDPIEFDEEIQQEGRVLREKLPGVIAEAYVYVSPATLERARGMVEKDADQEAEGTPPQSGKKVAEEIEKSLSLSMAYRLMAACHNAEQNRQYANPLTDPPCLCASCSQIPAGTTICLCSGPGCQPGQNERDWIIRYRANWKKVLPDINPLARQMFPNNHPTLPPPPPRPPINLREKPMRQYVTERLTALRLTMFNTTSPDYTCGGLYTPEDFIPDAVIPIILDNFFALDSPDTLSRLTKDFSLVQVWIDCIWHDIHGAIPRLVEIHNATRQAELEKKKIASEKAKEKRRDAREKTEGIRRKLPTDDMGENFVGQRWRYTNTDGSKTVVTLRLGDKLDVETVKE